MIEKRPMTDFNPYQAPTAVLAPQAAPEGVGELASRGNRLAAAMLDGLIPGLAAVLVVVAFMQAPKGDEGSMTGAIVFGGLGGLIGLAWVVWNLILVSRYGQTQGKRWMKIRVERPDGTVASFSRILFMRGMIVALLGAIPVVGGLVGLVDPLLIFREDRRCLHDMIADTVVRNAPQD